jgi:hypothetical protein
MSNLIICHTKKEDYKLTKFRTYNILKESEKLYLIENDNKKKASYSKDFFTKVNKVSVKNILEGLTTLMYVGPDYPEHLGRYYKVNSVTDNRIFFLQEYPFNGYDANNFIYATDFRKILPNYATKDNSVTKLNPGDKIYIIKTKMIVNQNNNSITKIVKGNHRIISLQGKQNVILEALPRGYDWNGKFKVSKELLKNKCILIDSNLR